MNNLWYNVESCVHLGCEGSVPQLVQNLSSLCPVGMTDDLQEQRALQHTGALCLI